MKYVLFLVITVSLSFAFIPWSFRYQSTADLFEDDYDLLFDPARISEIEGSRVYTSLSNFVTGTENLFSNNGMPFILIGGSTDLVYPNPGFVYDLSSRKTGLFTGLLDPYGNFLYGEGEVTDITWNDDDDNGVYDRRTIETEQRTAYSKNNEADYFIAIGAKRNNLRWGLGFMRNEYGNTYTNPVNNFNYEYTEEDLTSASYTLIQRASSTGNSIYSVTSNNLILSVWLDRDNWSLGLKTGYGMFSWGNEEIIFADSVIYTYPEDSLSGDYTNADILDSLNAPQSGSRIPVYLTLFYNYNENAQGRFYLGFSTESHKYSDDALGYYAKTRENIYDEFTRNYDTTYTYYSGSGNTKTITAGTKHLWKINPRFNFGIGVLFTTASITDSTAYNDVVTSVEVYDDNDGQTIDPDDYIQTIWSSETWMTRSTGSVKSLTFPVGVEFFVLNPSLCLRLGAVHTLTFTDITTVHQMIQFEPERTRIEYGDGTVNETMEDPGYSSGYEETQTETTPGTDYVFGLGWQVNKNLQIDLMGFTDLTDMTNWRISATLKL